MRYGSPLKLVIAWLVVGLLSCETAAARTMQQIRNEGTLRVGVAIATPWALRNAERELVGFEIDVANRLARDLEVEPIIIAYPFNDLIRALEIGEIDLIAAGLTITPERALHVNFSDPYAASGITLATHLDNTADVEQLTDLNDARFSIAAIRGSVSAELVRRNFPAAELIEFDDAEAAGRALVDGRVDAYLEEEPLPTFLALDNPARVDLPLAGPLLETKAGFAIAKGDPDFLAFLNAWIVARESDTWLPAAHEYWFKSLRWRREAENAERLR